MFLVIGVIDLVVPIKSSRIKQKSQDWFDGELEEKISDPGKLFNKFKKWKLHIEKCLNRKYKVYFLRIDLMILLLNVKKVLKGFKI